jgi:hypothetical protein
VPDPGSEEDERGEKRELREDVNEVSYLQSFGKIGDVVRS